MLFEHGFNLTILKMIHDLTHWNYTEKPCYRTDYFIEVFVCKNVAHVMTTQCFDVRKFNVDTILYGENQCKKNGFFCFVLAVFSVGFWLDSGKICKSKDHTCLCHCINTCLRCLMRCLNTWPNSLKQLPQDPANVMHEKTCVIPIHYMGHCLIEISNY